MHPSIADPLIECIILSWKRRPTFTDMIFSNEWKANCSVCIYNFTQPGLKLMAIFIERRFMLDLGLTLEMWNGILWCTSYFVENWPHIKCPLTQGTLNEDIKSDLLNTTKSSIPPPFHWFQIAQWLVSMYHSGTLEIMYIIAILKFQGAKDLWISLFREWKRAN